MEESEAITKCQKGEPEAFGFLVEKYKRRAYFTALALVGSHDDALDLSQEAFVRAYRSIGKYNTRYRFFTWLYRILRNLCLNHLRNNRRRAEILQEAGDSVTGKNPENPSLLVERDEVKEAVWSALSDLKAHEREIIILRDFQELSYREISDALDCPLGTVMSRLFHARKALKDKLGKYL